MPTQKRDPSWSSAATILQAVVPRVADPARWRQYRVWGVWDEAVGPAVARKARPSRIHNGKLFVTVSSSAYMQELHFSKAAIRQKLNEKLGPGTVSDVFFVIGRVGEVAGREPAPPRLPPPPHTELTVPPLDRPELEAALRRLLDARRRRLSQKEQTRERAT